MNRIQITSLSGVSNLSVNEMSNAVGGLSLRPPVKCKVELVTVRGPFGIKLKLPKPVCKVQSPIVF